MVMEETEAVWCWQNGKCWKEKKLNWKERIGGCILRGKAATVDQKKHWAFMYICIYPYQCFQQEKNFWLIQKETSRRNFQNIRASECSECHITSWGPWSAEVLLFYFIFHHEAMYTHYIFKNSLFLGIFERVVAIFWRFLSFVCEFETTLNIDKVACGLPGKIDAISTELRYSDDLPKSDCQVGWLG